MLLENLHLIFCFCFLSFRFLSRYVSKFSTFDKTASALLQIGDSGGPIFGWTGHYWEQVGVVSYGFGCADRDYPGIYTRLSYYYRWIKEILEIGGEHVEPSIQPTTTARTTTTTFQTPISSSARSIGGSNRNGQKVLAIGIMLLFINSLVCHC